jgi:hypothetical protein
MKNKILHLALVVTRIIMILVITIGTLLLGVMIYWPFDPSLFDLFYFSTENGLTITTEAEKGTKLESIEAGYFYFLSLKGLIELSLFYLILRNVIGVVKSIESLKTFHQANIKAFRRMGRLFVVWFLIEIPEVNLSALDTSIALQVVPGYAVGALICFVLAEIFSEGNQLMEENQLTI